jgi:hypothetical protein
LLHRIPFESNFQALCHAIIGKTVNPSVVNGVVFKGQRVEEVFAIHNPVPATRAPL